MAPNRLCLITALAPVPAFLGGSCPLGCSLNAPATGGCSVFSLQWSMYAAGSEKEKRAGCPLHGATIAQLFVFCKGAVAGASDSGVRPPMGTDGFVLACALLQGRVWLGGRSPISEGVWLGGRHCPTTPPTFLETGGHPLYPRRGLRPCTLLGERREVSFAHRGRRGTLPSLPPRMGVGAEGCPCLGDAVSGPTSPRRASVTMTSSKLRCGPRRLVQSIQPRSRRSVGCRRSTLIN